MTIRPLNESVCARGSAHLESRTPTDRFVDADELEKNNDDEGRD